MAREPVAIDFVGLGVGGMGVQERGGGGSSRGGSGRLVRPIPHAVPDVRQLAAGVQAMSTTSAAVSEGFRHWSTDRVDTSSLTGLCRPNPHVMATGKLRSKESYGMITADNNSCLTKQVEEGHSVGHTAQVAKTDNNKVVNTDVPPGGQSLPQHSVEQDNNMVAAAHSLAARPHSSGNQPAGTGQLTIFYAGMVNVYDEVPLEKAQAIMVLAGRARTWASSNDTNAPGSGVPAPVATSQSVSRVGSPSPQLTIKLPECVPRPKSTTTRVELPQARKASLARFLERRKDRLRTGPYTSATYDVTMRASPRQSVSQNLQSAMSSPSRS